MLDLTSIYLSQASRSNLRDLRDCFLPLRSSRCGLGYSNYRDLILGLENPKDKLCTSLGKAFSGEKCISKYIFLRTVHRILPPPLPPLPPLPPPPLKVSGVPYKG